jgi:hypothetical protein
MRRYFQLVLLALCPSVALCQLTAEQKVADFHAMESLLAKRYGPYEWKRDALKFDLMDTVPWVAKVQATKDDLDFYEVMIDYLSGLNDAHVTYILPANFAARLNFTVDLYDGKLLVDSINRNRLPANEFGFQTGYELLSIDGADALKVLDGMRKYVPGANPRSTRRLATSLVTARSQNIVPHAADVPEISTVTFRRGDNSVESYRIPWTKTGLALVSVGRYTTPRAHLTRPERSRLPVEPVAEEPPYLKVFAELQNCLLPDKGFLGFGLLSPVFSAAMPAGFTQRLGRLGADPFYSGVFEAGGYKIGFIRIPTFQPSNTAAAITAFRGEIEYFQANTAGLIVDTMRNFGGSAGYANQLLASLMPAKWRSIPFELRATSEWVLNISSALTFAQALGAPPGVIDSYQAIKDAIVAANREMRGRTTPVPLDDLPIERDPLVDARGASLAYTKPLILLVDEMTASAAEIVAASIQDNERGPVVGWRTMGAGGNVELREAGTYSLTSMTVTEGLMIRKNAVATAEYPTAPYIENIGVRPEISLDYMTRDNLLQNGRPFVDSFVAAMVAEIRKVR